MFSFHFPFAVVFPVYKVAISFIDHIVIMEAIISFDRLDTRSLNVSLRVQVVQKWTVRNGMFGYNCHMILMDANMSIGYNTYNTQKIYIVYYNILLTIRFVLIGADDSSNP